MQFEEEHTQNLKDWIIKRLENMYVNNSVDFAGRIREASAQSFYALPSHAIVNAPTAVP